MPADSVSNTVPDYLSLLRLDGRGFVVLGAGKGIGAPTVHALTQAGARVLCVDQDEKLARDIADPVCLHLKNGTTRHCGRLRSLSYNRSRSHDLPRKPQR